MTPEHKEILDTANALERAGKRVTWLGVQSDGLIDLDELRDAITDKTLLISIMYANNEIGCIQRLLPDREARMAEADAIADEMLLCEPLAVQAIKRIVTIGRELPVEYSEHFAKPIQDAIDLTEDRLEGPKAFAEKRPPVWKMR